MAVLTDFTARAKVNIEVAKAIEAALVTKRTVAADIFSQANEQSMVFIE